MAQHITQGAAADRTYFVWWAGPHGPELRNFDTAAELLCFLHGWQENKPDRLIPEPGRPGRGWQVFDDGLDLVLQQVQRLDRIYRGLEGWHEDALPAAWQAVRVAIAEATGERR